VGAIHGRLLTAWSTAGILGPVLVNYLHDTRKSEGVPAAHLYDVIFYYLVGLLVIGLIANLLIRPVAAKWFILPERAESMAAHVKVSHMSPVGSFGIGKGGLTPAGAVAWAIVGIPIAWGVFDTIKKMLVLFS
jgi:hypothetical protein